MLRIMTLAVLLSVALWLAGEQVAAPAVRADCFEHGDIVYCTGTATPGPPPTGPCIEHGDTPYCMGTVTPGEGTPTPH